MTNYTIEVKTGKRKYAGTDARVYIQLIGAKRNSDPQNLDNPNHPDFERKQLDRFKCSMEDVGWIDAIRMYHDNRNSDPGWYLDYVNVINEDVGLSFKARFDRWLADDEGDKSIDVTRLIPVKTVTISKGHIVSYFMGYTIVRKANHSSTPTNFKETFSFQYKQGMALKKTTGKTKAGGLKIGVDFFSFKCEFTDSATKTITRELDTLEEQTTEATSSIEFTLQPNQSITLVSMYFQNILEGEAEGSGITMGFEEKLSIDTQVIELDGWLSNDEVEQYIFELLKQIIGSAGGTSNPIFLQSRASLPSNIPESDARIAIAEKAIAGPLNRANLQTILSTISKKWLKFPETAQVGHAKELENVNIMLKRLVS